MMESEIKFGTAGPYVFWRTLEILAREDAIEEPLVVNFKVFKAWFPSTSAPKLLKVLSYFDHKLRISCSKDGDDIKIFCDKLALISDTYTKYIRRNVEATAKNSCARRKKKKKEETKMNY